jgi:hypothetical protein
MTIDRMLMFAILLPTIAVGGAKPALAQACSREGPS